MRHCRRREQTKSQPMTTSTHAHARTHTGTHVNCQRVVALMCRQKAQARVFCDRIAWQTVFTESSWFVLRCARRQNFTRAKNAENSTFQCPPRTRTVSRAKAMEKKTHPRLKKLLKKAKLGRHFVAPHINYRSSGSGVDAPVCLKGMGVAVNKLNRRKHPNSRTRWTPAIAGPGVPALDNLPPLASSTGWEDDCECRRRETPFSAQEETWAPVLVLTLLSSSDLLDM